MAVQEGNRDIKALFPFLVVVRPAAHVSETIMKRRIILC